MTDTNMDSQSDYNDSQCDDAPCEIVESTRKKRKLLRRLLDGGASTSASYSKVAATAAKSWNRHPPVKNNTPAPILIGCEDEEENQILKAARSFTKKKIYYVGNILRCSEEKIYEHLKSKGIDVISGI